MSSSPTACFFARVADRSLLDRVEFYAQDLQILSDLGFDVRVATRGTDLCGADLYFVWWWTWAFLPLGYAQARRRPSVVTGAFNPWKFPGRPALHRSLIRYALRTATANVFLSRHEAVETARLAPVNNAHYVPLGTQTDFYRPSERDRDGALVFSVISNGAVNAERKCARQTVEAAALVAARHPGTSFVIAGDQGELRSELEALAATLGVSSQIQFIGSISREHKRHLMRTCSVYLQPSRYEGFGLAILEAMSSGAPVVASPVGSVPEVAGASARYVDGTAPTEIAAAVSDLLGNSARRASLGREGRDRAVSCFSYRRRRAEMEELLGEVCDAARRPAPAVTPSRAGATAGAALGPAPISAANTVPLSR